jgi:hypothetical protein
MLFDRSNLVNNKHTNWQSRKFCESKIHECDLDVDELVVGWKNYHHEILVQTSYMN